MKWEFSYLSLLFTKVLTQTLFKKL